jgi:Flp pilus assembly protein TadG
MMTTPKPERNHPPKSRLRERGAELVEAAFVLPLLLTLLIGVFWAARAYNIYETITRAAREGARVAVAPTCATCGNSYPASTAVQTAVNNVLSSAGMNTSGSGIAINIQQHQQLGLDPNNPVAAWTIVGITYPYQFTLPFSSLNMATINISTQVQMLEEQ